MSLTRQRLTLVMPGVSGMDRARRLSQGRGWAAHSASQPGVTFFQMAGAVLALFGRDDLAADQAQPGAALGAGAVALAQNGPDEAATDAVLQAAVDAGATVLKRPERVFRGSCSGQFADPDGHVREIATNPFRPLAGNGSLTLPDA